MPLWIIRVPVLFSYIYIFADITYIQIYTYVVYSLNGEAVYVIALPIASALAPWAAPVPAPA